MRRSCSAALPARSRAHWLSQFPGSTCRRLRQKIAQLSAADAAVFQLERAGEWVYIALQL
jgi:hypothetical protein